MFIVGSKPYTFNLFFVPASSSSLLIQYLSIITAIVNGVLMGSRMPDHTVHNGILGESAGYLYQSTRPPLHVSLHPSLNS